MNLRQPGYKAGALPTELRQRILKLEPGLEPGSGHYGCLILPIKLFQHKMWAGLRVITIDVGEFSSDLGGCVKSGDVGADGEEIGFIVPEKKLWQPGFEEILDGRDMVDGVGRREPPQLYNIHPNILSVPREKVALCSKIAAKVDDDFLLRDDLAEFLVAQDKAEEIVVQFTVLLGKDGFIFRRRDKGTQFV